MGNIKLWFGMISGATFIIGLLFLFGANLLLKVNKVLGKWYDTDNKLKVLDKDIELSKRIMKKRKIFGIANITTSICLFIIVSKQLLLIQYIPFCITLGILLLIFGLGCLFAPKSLEKLNSSLNRCFNLDAWLKRADKLLNSENLIIKHRNLLGRLSIIISVLLAISIFTFLK